MSGREVKNAIAWVCIGAIEICMIDMNMLTEGKRALYSNSLCSLGGSAPHNPRVACVHKL